MELSARAPFRLDLTVAVLRRLSTNLVDVVGADGVYRRAFAGAAGPVAVSVRQTGPATIAVETAGESGEAERFAALVQRMLGLDRDLARFYSGAAQFAWLNALAGAMRGVKPPRYPSLWEACVNAVVFQQVSIHAAAAILGRTIVALGEPVRAAGGELHAFPSAASFLGASDAVLRSAGLSVGKVATLRRIADALQSGALDEAMLEERDSSAAAARLCEIKGVGPWTAAVILLRGLGRLDVFPQNDSGAARSLRAAAPGVAVDVASVLEALGEQRGFLYYHLLLARLAERGEIV